MVDRVFRLVHMQVSILSPKPSVYSIGSWLFLPFRPCICSEHQKGVGEAMTSGLGRNEPVVVLGPFVYCRGPFVILYIRISFCGLSLNP